MATTSSVGPSFQQLQLSKVSDVLNIRKNSHYHGVDVITQIASISPPHSAYKYFNCYVVDDEDEDSRKKFSFKVTTAFFPQVIDLNVGDIIRIRKAIRYNAKRTSQGYTKRPDDLDLQLNAWEESSVDILSSVFHQEIENFGILTMPFKNITLRGVVDTLPEEHGGKWVFMLNDLGGNDIEIQYGQVIDVKVGDECVVQGDSVKHSGMIYVAATKITPVATTRLMENHVVPPTVPVVPTAQPSDCLPPAPFPQIVVRGAPMPAQVLPVAPMPTQANPPVVPILPQALPPVVPIPPQALPKTQRKKKGE